MARARTTNPKRGRRRERLGILAAVVVAAGSGLLAAHFGTRRSWENSPATTPTSAPASSVDPQRTP